MMKQVIRLGLMPNMPGMILMEHGGNSLYDSYMKRGGLVNEEF